MRRLIAAGAALSTLAFGAVLSACTADPAAPAATAPACDPALDAAFGAWSRAGFSGSVTITTGGRPDCLAAYGTDGAGTPITPDSVFEIGSITKAVTAATVLGLADAGALSLDDTAGEHVPGLTGPAADVTLAQLLLHTSGLTGNHGEDSAPLSRDEAVAAIGDLDLAFEPGTDDLYSNAGYTLLALVVEEVAEAGYRGHTAATTLNLPDGTSVGGFWNGEPAAPGPRAVGVLEGGGTGETGAFAGPHWALDGNGGVAMTSGRLAAWTHALFTGGIIPPAAVDVLHATRVDHGEGLAEVPGWGVADASVYGEPLLSTAGGGGETGHNVVAVWLPERERAIVMASNGPEITAEQLLDAVGPALLAREPLPVPEEPEGEADPAAAGTYALDTGGSFEVTVADGTLTIAAVGADATAAVFPPAGVAPEEVRAHEDRVTALLAGGEEREQLDADFGPLTGVEPIGTVTLGGELRTYVRLTSASGEHTGWYAVDEAGGVSGAEVPTDPPSLPFVPSGGGYRPDDPTGTGPDVTVSFEDGTMTVTGPAGQVTARRDG